MLRGRCREASFLLLLAIGLTSGCSAHTPNKLEGPGETNLLFGCDRSAILATQIGRSDWPATPGRVEGIQHTLFMEYYRDHQGHSFLESNNPRRVFRSYRIGTQHR
ncbi:MAG: hypothetical protein ABII12_04030 [Planctomycetota bacterium]